MAKNDNLKDFLVDVADAIREKKGTTDLINPQSFSDEIRAFEIGGGGGAIWTGHADAEGLRAIGWTDEDIAYYQENGVNWNEEDDEYHKVSEDNKALYGVLTADNIQTYKDRIVYLPKIDTKGYGNLSSLFINCHTLVSLPKIDTSDATMMASMFNTCLSLTCIPPLDTSKVGTMANMCQTCVSLISFPYIDTANVYDMNSMFNTCYSLKCLPPLDVSNVTNMANMFYGCHSLVGVPYLNALKASNMNGIFQSCHALVSVKGFNKYNSDFSGCYALTHAYLSNQTHNLSLIYSSKISKDSLLYIINNEAATSAITIKLASYAYNKWSVDADVIAALEAHPRILLASA